MQMTLTYRWCFLNILVSYLHFSDFVWISYEVFKLMVKRSKGKSIIGAKWLGQNQWLLGIRGKTDEWDTTRCINLIIPKFIHFASYRLCTSVVSAYWAIVLASLLSCATWAFSVDSTFCAHSLVARPHLSISVCFCVPRIAIGLLVSLENLWISFNIIDSC